MTDPLHNEFLDRLDDSEKFRWIAAMILVSQGKTVTIPPMTKAKNFADRHNHSDHGDLFVNGHVIAIKSSSYDWTCREDWPFDKYIVGSVKEIDDLRPLWIMNFNKAGTHYGRVCAVTSDHWHKENKASAYTNNPAITHDCYVCGLRMVEFHEVAV